MKIIAKIIKYIVLLILSITALLVAVIIVVSPGKLEPKQDQNGNILANSITEKVQLNINGIEQGMFIVGENKDNPILLFLHGGPGFPVYPMFSEDLHGLEKNFTVCYWDQRGAGMSYSFNMDDFSVNNMIEDTKEVSLYLIQRFNQDKIYLVAHSWGTFLGIKSIEKYPELYKAFIGIGLMSDQIESEKLAYRYFLEQASAENDKQNLDILKKYNLDNIDSTLESKYLWKKNELLNKYAVGMFHKNPEAKKLFKDIFLFKGYNPIEKIKLVLGIFKSVKLLRKPILTDKLIKNNLEFKIPFYVIHGEYDYQVSYKLAKDYFELINAPKKEFFTFAESAHAPFYDEQDKFTEVMQKIKLENEQK